MRGVDEETLACELLVILSLCFAWLARVGEAMPAQMSSREAQGAGHRAGQGACSRRHSGADAAARRLADIVTTLRASASGQPAATTCTECGR